MPLSNAAPIQTRMMGLDWLILNPSGFIVKHCRSARQAEANCPKGCRIEYRPVG